MTPTVHVTRARLVPFRDGSEHAATPPGAWFITHGCGTPAENTYTEVSFAPEALTDTDGRPLPPDVLYEATRHVADLLYGTRWSFAYPPEEEAAAITRWGLRRRERVHVEYIDVW